MPLTSWQHVRFGSNLNWKSIQTYYGSLSYAPNCITLPFKIWVIRIHIHNSGQPALPIIDFREALPLRTTFHSPPPPPARCTLQELFKIKKTQDPSNSTDVQSNQREISNSSRPNSSSSTTRPHGGPNLRGGSNIIPSVDAITVQYKTMIFLFLFFFFV